MIQRGFQLKPLKPPRSTAGTYNENTVSSSSELNHLFIADSLQLTTLTSRFARAERFVTSIFEKLETVLSPSLDRIFCVNSRRSWQPASLILSIFYLYETIWRAARKHFRFKVHCSQVIKLSSRSLTKKSTKKLCSSSSVYFVRKNASNGPSYCFL